MNDLAKRMADLHARTEQTKVEFLEAELNECFTFINIADTEHSLGEQAAAEKAIASAEDGYAAIRRFLADIEHGEKRRDLQSNLVKLREVLDNLKRTNASRRDRRS